MTTDPTPGRAARATLVLIGLSLWIGRGVDVGPFDLQPVQLTVLFAVLIVVAVAVHTRSLPLAWLRRTPTAFLAAITLALTAIVAAAALSGVEATDPLSVVRFIARYVIGLALIVAVLQLVRRPANARALEAALLLGAWLSVAVSAVAHAFPTLAEIAIRYGDRAQALLNHPNQFAMLLSSVAPVAFARALREPRRIGPWVTLLVVGAGVAMTGSKVNIVLVAALLPAMALLAAQLRAGALQRMGATAALTLASLAVAAVAVWVVQTTNPRTLITIGRLFTDPAGTSAVVTRTQTWQLAIERGLERPWFGVGADHATYFLPYSHAHNVFAEFFLTLGATGLIALAFLLTALAALCAQALLTALTRPALATEDRLSLIAYPFAILAFVAASQSSDSFGGTTLPVLWIMTALTLAQIDRCSRA